MRTERMRSVVSALALLLVLTGCLAALPVAQGPGLQATPPPTAESASNASATVVPTATAVASDRDLASTPPVAPGADSAFDLLQAKVEEVYVRAGPAVVNVISRAIMYDWFNQPVPQEGTGSGFVFDYEGHIVTNYHVVANADSVSVALADGSQYAAEVVGLDPATDLAVLRIRAVDLPAPLALADSDQLRVGRFVVAIGNPFGLEQTMTMGIISSLGRVIESPDGRFIGEAIQTDAPINPGNSGGPLLDLEGRVIGVNSQIISPSRASAGIGFAVSSNTVRRVVPQLIATGRYPHPWLGVSLLSLTPDMVRLLNAAGAELPVEEGVLVLSVEPGGPADEAGLRAGRRTILVQGQRVPVDGDIIVQLDDEPILRHRDLMLYIDTRTEVGQEMAVTFLREGERLTTTLTLAERPTAN